MTRRVKALTAILVAGLLVPAAGNASPGDALSEWLLRSPCVREVCAAGVNAEAVAPTPDGAALLAISGADVLTIRTTARGLADAETVQRSSGIRGVTGTVVSVTIDPGGETAYATYQDGIAVLDRDPVTGAFGQRSDLAGCLVASAVVGCTTFAAIRGSAVLTLAPEGGFAYVSSPDRIIVLAQDASGGLTPLPGRAACVGSVATPRAYGCSDGGVGFLPGSGLGVTIVGANLYAWSSASIVAFSRGSGGQLTRLVGAGGCLTRLPYLGCTETYLPSAVRQLTFSQDGRHGFLDGAAVTAITRDPATGAFGPIAGVACASADGDPTCAPAPDISASTVPGVVDGDVYVRQYPQSVGRFLRFAITSAGLAVTDASMTCAGWRQCLPAAFASGVRSGSETYWLQGRAFASGQVAPLCATTASGHAGLHVTLVHDVASVGDQVCDDPNGGTLSVTPRDLGHASLSGGNLISERSFVGTYVATFDISDGALATTISLRITTANSPPTCADGTAVVHGNATVILTVLCSDPDPDAIGLALRSAPAHGSAGVTALTYPEHAFWLGYHPAPGFVGVEVLDLSAFDGATTTEVHVRIEVDPAVTVGVSLGTPAFRIGKTWHGMTVYGASYGTHVPATIVTNLDESQLGSLELRLVPLYFGQVAPVISHLRDLDPVDATGIVRARIPLNNGNEVAWNEAVSAPILLLSVGNFSLVGKRAGSRVEVTAPIIAAAASGRLVIERWHNHRWSPYAALTAYFRDDPHPRFSIAPDGARYRATFLPYEPRSFQGSFLTFTAPRRGGFTTPQTRSLGAAAMVMTLPR